MKWRIRRPWPFRRRVAETTTAATTAQKRRGRWKRWLLRIAVLVILLVVAIRLALPWIVPYALQKVADGLGLEARIERLELALLHGEVGFSGLVVRDPELGVDVAQAGFVRVRISWLDLLTGRIRLYRVDIDDLALTLERDEAGRWTWLEKLISAPADDAAIREAVVTPADDADATTSDGPLIQLADALALPIQVDALRLHRAKVQWRDAFLGVPLEARVELGVRAEHLGYQDNQPSRVEVDLSAAPGLSSMQLRAHLCVNPTGVYGEVVLDLRGIAADVYQRYLTLLHIDAPETAGDLHLRVSALLRDSAPQYLNGLIEIQDLRYTEGENVIAHLDRIAVRTETVAEEEIAIDQIEVRGFSASITTYPDGSLGFGGWHLRSAPPSATPTESDARALAVSSPSQPQPSNSTNESAVVDSSGLVLWPSSLPRLRVRELRVEAGALQLADAANTLPLSCQLERIELHNFDTRPAPTRAPARFKLHAAVPNYIGGLQLDGTLAPFEELAHADLRLRCYGLEPAALDQLLHTLGQEQLGVEAVRLEAQVSATMHRGVAEGDRIEARLQDLRVLDNENQALLQLELARGAVLLPRDQGPIVAEEIEIAGFDSRAILAADGTLHCAGIRIAAPTLGAASAPEAISDQGAEPAPELAADAPRSTLLGASTVEKSATPSFVLRQLEVKRLAFEFVDHSGALPEPIVLKEFELLLRNAHFPRPPAESEDSTLRLQASLPGLIDSIAMHSHFDSSADHPRFECSLDASGITAKRAAALLDRIGIRSELVDGNLSAKAEGELILTEGDLHAPLLRIETLTMADQERQLFALKEAQVKNLRYGLAATGNPSLEIQSIRWETCQTAVALRGSEGLAVLGFVLREPSPVPRSPTPESSRADSPAVGQDEAATPIAPTTSEPKSTEPQPHAALPADFHFHLGELDLPAIEIAITDPHGQTWPIALHSSARDLRFAPRSEAHAPGKLLIGASVADTLEAFEFRADIQAAPAHVGVHAELAARGLDLTPLARYLRDMGFEGEMRNGAAGVQLDAELEERAGALLASLRLSDLVLKDGEREWFGVNRIEAEGLRYEAPHADLGSWIIEKPRAELDLRPDGRMTMLGIVVGEVELDQSVSVAPAVAAPPIPMAADEQLSTAPASITVEPIVDPVIEEPAIEQTVVEVVEVPLREVSERLALALKSFALRDGRIAVFDHRRAESCELPVEFHIELGAIDTSKPTTPTPVRIEVLPKPGDGEIHIQGGISFGFDHAAFQLALKGRAIELDRYQAFWPSTMTAEGKHGELDGNIEGRLDRDPVSSDITAHFIAHDLRWTEASAPHPWLAWKNLSVALHRAHADATLTVEHLRWEGLDATVEHDHGHYRVLGFAFSPPAEPSAEHPSNPADESTRVTPAPPTPPPVPARRRRSPQRTELPRVVVKDLRIELEALRWLDHVDATTTEGGLAAVTVTTTQPIDCLGLNFADRDAMQLRVEGRVEPGIRSFEMDCDANPFAPRPFVALSFKSEGIDAPALRAAAPVLLASLQAENLQGASFVGQIETELLFARRGPLDFDLSQRFGLFLNVRGVELKNPQGDVLLGMQELFVSAPRIELDRGYAFIRRVDITRPQLQLTRTQRGWEALGIVLETPPEPAPEPNALAAKELGASPSSGSDAAQPTRTMVYAARTEQTTAPAFIAELQEFQIFGGEFMYADRRVEPPLLVPLESIDLAVQNLSSVPSANAVPIEFELSILAGEVPLPKRAAAGVVPGMDFVTGVLGGLAHSVAGSSRAIEMESRPLFQELRAEALFTSSWPPQGHIDFELSGFELSALTSIAKRASVDIADGVLDANIDIKIDPRGVVHGRNRFFFSYLDIDEPADGPIRRYLKLPAPLNVVVFATMDDTGAVRIPVDFDQAVGTEMARGQIMGIAIDSLARTLSHALERSAFRVVGVVTNFGDSLIGGLPLIGDIWNFFFSNAVPAEILEPIEIPFAPGDGYLATDYIERVEEMVKRMRSYSKLDVVVEHYAGAADLKRAELIGSPSKEDLQSILARLDREMAIATRTRDVLLGQIEAAILADRSRDAVGAREELKQRAERIGELLEIKHQALRWLDERRASESERRTRTIQREFARLRMESAQRALLEASAGDDFSKRIRMPRPRPNVPDFEGGGKIVLKPALRRR